MKNITKYVLFLLIGTLAVSCSEKYETYSSPINRLGFYYGYDAYNRLATDSVLIKSFAFYPTTTTEETVWLEVRTMGYVSDKDRTFEVEQVNVTDAKNAVSGTHYASFDKKYFVIPAGQIAAKFPVILKRDASLSKEKVVLKLKIKVNENFQLGYPEKQVAIIEFSDILMKPKLWDIQAKYHFGGEYSYEKFRFMVDVATWILDDAWFEKNFKNASVVDMGYAAFVSAYFVTAIQEENARRKARGLGLLMEKYGNGERSIQFTKYGKPQPNE